MRSTDSLEPRSTALSSLLVLFVFVDTLFLPRLSFAFSIPMSLLVVIASLSQQHVSRRDLVVLLVLTLTMLVSVQIGTATNASQAPFENLKRALQLVSILLFALYRFELASIVGHVLAIFRLLILYSVVAALTFYFVPVVYESMLNVAYPEALEIFASNLEYLRFPYIFADPNSAAYFYTLLLVGYLALERDSRSALLGASLLVLLVVMTQSRGGYLALGIVLLQRLVVSSVSATVKAAVALVIGVSVVTAAILFFDEISVAYAVFDARLQSEEDFGGGRLGKYVYFIEHFNVLPVGNGYYLHLNGEEFRPHSDLIRLDMAYGVLALPLLVYFLLPRSPGQGVLFAVLLVPFLVNSVVDDYRLLGLYFLLKTLVAQCERRNETSAPNDASHLGTTTRAGG